MRQRDSIADIPDDGSDKPGYPSNAMSLKFWRHDRAPRVGGRDPARLPVRELLGLLHRAQGPAQPARLRRPERLLLRPFTTPVSAYATGITPRPCTADNDYGIDRVVQRDGIFSGIRDFASQDMMGRVLGTNADPLVREALGLA